MESCSWKVGIGIGEKRHKAEIVPIVRGRAQATAAYHEWSIQLDKRQDLLSHVPESCK